MPGNSLVGAGEGGHPSPMTKMAGGKNTQLLCFRRTEAQFTLQSFLQDPAIVTLWGTLPGFHSSLSSCLSHPPMALPQEHSCNNFLYTNPCPRRTQSKIIEWKQPGYFFPSPTGSRVVPSNGCSPPWPQLLLVGPHCGCPMQAHSSPQC